MLKTIIRNLLSNAIKFTPNGGSVSLFIALLPPADNHKSMLYICVSDTGSGIPDDDTIKIFNRFYQSQGQTKYPMYGQAGSGIGLYLCKRIVQMHGGEIHAQKQPYDRLLATHPPANNTGKQYGGNTGRKCPATYDFRCATPIQYFRKRFINPGGWRTTRIWRGYIRSILRDKYNVFEAAHGAEA